MAEQNGSLLDEQKEIRTEKDAAEWIAAFRETTGLSRLMGLLHDGLATFGHSPEIVCHYLGIADGYRRADDRGYYDRFAGRRVDALVEMKKKAFKMLCEHFFRGPKCDNRRPCYDEQQAPWLRHVTNPEVFEKILWFLDHGKTPGDHCNFPLDYQDARQAEVFRAFTKEFIRLVLRRFEGNHAWSEPDERDLRIRKMFLDARPRIIALMVDVECLDVLWGFNDPFGPPVYLDEASMVQLEEVALRVSFKEKHESLAAACLSLSNSKEARAVLVLRAIQAEHARQEKVKEAERVAAEEAERQTELHQAEQALLEAQERLADLRDAAELKNT